MQIFEILLITSGLLCSLLAGLVFTFAVVVIPGIKKLTDRDFVRAFQVINGVIQNNQPLFLLVRIGSALSLIVCTIVGSMQLNGYRLIMLLTTTAVYFLTIQLPTIVINIPLNNQLQRLDVENLTEAQLHQSRTSFVATWNFWNGFRTLLQS